jgi:hypothetical protein
LIVFTSTLQACPVRKLLLFVPQACCNAIVLAFHDLNALDADGKQFSFAQLAGKVCLITNVASQCGFTDSHCKRSN